jgi:hypothetical protein
VADEIPPQLELSLKHPVSWGENEIVAIKIHMPPWRALCEVKDRVRSAGEDAIKEALVTASIKGFVTKEGTDYPVQKRVLEQMSKLDRERCRKAYSLAAFPEPDLRFGVVCEGCSFEIETTVNWTWDFFFGAGSLPKASIL